MQTIEAPLRKKSQKQLYQPPPQHQSYQRLVVLLIISSALIAGQIAYGLISNSIAIISDAIHLVTGLIGLLLSYLFLYLSKKKPTSKMTFGYHRMQLFGALCYLFVIWVLLLLIVFEATQRIIDKEHVQKPFLMLVTAGGGLVIKIIMYKVLEGAQKHQHSYNHEQEKNEDNKINKSLGMQAIIYYALAGIVMSIGLILSSLIVFILGNPNGYLQDVNEWNPWHLSDPISTYIFAIIALMSTIPVLRNSYYLMMESTPNLLNIEKLKESFQGIKGVKDVHDIHAWELKSGKTVAIAHMLVKKNRQRQVLIELWSIARKNNIFHSTFQIEEEEWKDQQDYILCHHDIH